MELKNVIVVNDFNYVQGGASKVAIDTAKILKEKGLKVYFFCAVSNPSENIEGIHYITTNQEESLKSKNKLKGIINGIYNLKAKRELKKLLQNLDRNTTIIHVHGWTKALSSSIFDIAFKMKFRVVLTLHDYFTACPNGGYFNYKNSKICTLTPLSMKCMACNCDSRNYMFKLYRIIRQFVQNNIVKLNKRIENVITISELSEKVLRITLNENTKITRIYNPIYVEENVKRIDPRLNKYFLYVGRISKEKGVDRFCKAITELEYEGIAVGDGEEREKLSQQYTNIKFVGWKDKEEVKEYMKNARALIIPSRWYEGAPLTPLEAMAMGLPCIISNECAAREYISNGIDGYTFKDIQDLKQKIEYLMDDEKLNIIAENAYKSYCEKHHNKQKYAEDIISFYKEI